MPKKNLVFLNILYIFI